MALDSRFSSTCFRRMRSARTTRPAATSVCSAICRGWASGSDSASASCTSSARLSASGDSASRPDSTWARSSTSLIRRSRWRPARSTSRRWPRERAPRSRSSSISCAKPRMAFSGVRSSWLMLDRNSVFARLACCAVSRAATSSRVRALTSSSSASRCRASARSAWRRSVMSSTTANTRCSAPPGARSQRTARMPSSTLPSRRT